MHVPSQKYDSCFLFVPLVDVVERLIIVGLSGLSPLKFAV